jgi:hypothetical protein
MYRVDKLGVTGSSPVPPISGDRERLPLMLDPHAGMQL